MASADTGANAKGHGTDLTDGEVDICGHIRRARRFGNTRCGVVEGGRMSVREVARAFGLADDSTIYRPIGGAEADAIATRLLHTDLAYGVEIMSLPYAADLWRQFKKLFDGQDVEFVTNQDATDVAAGSYSWAPATAATFDLGVLVIGAAKAGCLWVEDED
jgi:hypothetical protein